MATQAPLDTPPGINTRRGREAGPKLSGNWLLFARYGRSGQAILLYDLTRERKTRLDSLPYPGHLEPGAVVGNWAVWTRCRRWAHCHTSRYDIAADRTLRLPNPRNRSQHAASVTADGAVYYREPKHPLR